MKTRKIQRLVAIILILSMCFPFSAFALEPTGVGSNEELALDSCCLEDIRTNFETNIFEDESFDPLNYYSAAQTGTDVLNIFDSLSSTLLVMYDSGNLNAVEYETVAQNLQNARNNKLDELDEVYYILTLDNIDEVESELQTDFSSIGIDFSGDAADSSFLILIDGDDANNDISPQSSIGSTTTYTYTAGQLFTYNSKTEKYEFLGQMFWNISQNRFVIQTSESYICYPAEEIADLNEQLDALNMNLVR